MKRTREFTSIHYRRSVKRPVSQELHACCPVCGSALDVIVVATNNPGNPRGAGRKIEERAIFPLVREGPEGYPGGVSEK